MKFSSYQSRVQLNTATPTVQAAGNERAYGMGGRPYQQVAGALDKVGAVLQKKQDEQDAADLLDARNKIMTSLTNQLYNSETGLMTTGVGENAKGLADRVTDAVRNTTDDVAKDYNSRVQKTLQRNLRENMENFQRNAASREAAEAQKMVGVRYKANLENSAQLAALNYNNDETINQQLKDGATLTTAMAQQLGQNSLLPAHLRDMTTNVIGAAVKSAMEAEDYQRANTLLTNNKEAMNQATWNSLHHTNSKLLEQQTKKNLLEAALSADSYGEAINMIDESDLSAADKRRMSAAVRSEFGVSLRGSGGGAGGTNYTKKQFASDVSDWNTYMRNLVQGNSISSSQWTKSKEIIDRMEEAGVISDDVLNDVYKGRADQAFQSDLTDVLELGGYDKAFQYMIDKLGYSREAAAIILSETDIRYQKTGRQDREENTNMSDEDIKKILRGGK